MAESFCDNFGLRNVCLIWEMLILLRSKNVRFHSFRHETDLQFDRQCCRTDPFLTAPIPLCPCPKNHGVCLFFC